MNLIDVYTVSNAVRLLYELLSEREPGQSISHKRMPTMAEHLSFVMSKPYREWFLIEVDGAYVGAVYLSKQNEVGIGIFRKHRGNGYGKQAVAMLMDRHKGERLIANINPTNIPSLNLFKSLGFRGPIQVSLEYAST